MRKSLLLLILCAMTALCTAGYAQVGRLLPDKGERGRTGASQPLPAVAIGNQLFRLAPGGVIYDQQNRFLVHSDLPANADVLYERDPAGNIQRIYVLTDLEKSLLDRAGRR